MNFRASSQNLPVLRFLSNVADGEADDKESIYRAIGVEPIINCRGTFTIIGGSVERPETLAAYKEAARHFVQYDELAEAVGERLADLTGAEWGLIADGCAAGLKHVTAACVTGGNPEKLIRIPNLNGIEKCEVIAPAYSRNPYDHAIRNIGVEMITVDSADEMERAISRKTALIYVVAGPHSAQGQPLSLERIVEIARPAGVPVLVDAAAENLTIPSVHLEAGADVVAYSGGKAICGPQGAGLVLGNKRILQAAWQASSPHHGPNRDNKIGREEILGMLAAVEAWLVRDHEAEWQVWLDRLDHIAARVKEIPGVETVVEQPAGLGNRAPVLRISWDPHGLHITGEEVAEICARSTPRIALGAADEGDRAGIRITPSQMQTGEEEVVSERLHQILSQERPAPSDRLEAPAADLSGHWDLTIEYAAGNSRHRLFLEQEGNWVTGMHQSEFSTQEISGYVEGDTLKLHSRFQQPGDSIPFLFSGTVTDESMAGSIFLGEYLTASFSGERIPYTAERKPFQIPGGPPLAT